MDGYENLRVERVGDAARVVVARPDKLNTLDAATVRELQSAFEALSADDDVRGVVVTGEGEKAFAAGADIPELARMTALDGVRTSRAGQRAFLQVERLGKPVIAALNGYALGGGLELALACHLRIAASTARMGLPEVKLGIIPGYGGTARLPRLVGRGRALELILTGEMIDAEEAHRIGLVNRVVPADRLQEEAMALLRRILANGPVALRLALEAVDHGADSSLEEALLFESNLFGLLAGTDDMREGMGAFLEKRPPSFRGR
jgi:enoyl-CoA hydratase